LHLTDISIQSSIFAALGPVPTSDTTANVFIVPSSFTVLPGESQTVVASIIPPSGLDASLYPVYSGAIEITSSGSDVTHVSYLGLAASLKDKQVVDNTDKFFGFKLPAVLDAAQAVQTAPRNYTFANSDFPSLVWRLVLFHYFTENFHCDDDLTLPFYLISGWLSELLPFVLTSSTPPSS
jgi:hypothetical protein